MSRDHRSDPDPVDDTGTELVTSAPRVPARAEELPVVARLVVEIRSDGRRTIARGAMEDVASGKSVALEARGDSPLQLATALARSVFSLPALARSATRGLLARRRR